MNVEKLVKELKTQDKQQTLEAMRKLITMIADTPKTQEEIIKFLPGRDIIKLMRNLEDNDPIFRKLTAKFFLDLVHGNYIVQQVFCDILGIVPCDGKVCLNRIPDSFKNATKSFIECLEQLKKTSPEELKEELPFCWYLSVENVERSGKKIEFLYKSETAAESFDVENFVDPLHAMVGFIMRNPRLYERRFRQMNEKSSQKASENAKKISTITGYSSHTNSVSARLANSSNNSLDHSMNRRLLNETSRSPNSSKVYTCTSPIRGSIGKNTVFSTRYNYKPKQTTASSTKSSSQSNAASSKTERLVLVGYESSRDKRNNLTYKSIERDDNVESKHLDSVHLQSQNERPNDSKRDNKRSPMRDTETSLDNLGTYVSGSKFNANINDSREMSGKMLETSLNSSMNQGVKSSGTMDLRSPNAKVSVNTKESKATGVLASQSGNMSKKFGDKSTDYDRRLKKDHERKQLFKSKDTSATQSSSSTPKNNLLTKLLKDKPLVFKDSTYSHKYKSIQDNIKKQGTSTTSNKSRPATQGSNQQKIIEKLEQQYISKKQAFHSSLMKSLDATSSDKGHLLISTMEENEETRPDGVQARDIKTANPSSTKERASYLTSFGFKSPISTPRVQNEIKSSSINTAKLLNARKSHDISYLTKHQKRNSNDMLLNSTATQGSRALRTHQE